MSNPLVRTESNVHEWTEFKKKLQKRTKPKRSNLIRLNPKFYQNQSKPGPQTLLKLSLKGFGSLNTYFKKKEKI